MMRAIMMGFWTTYGGNQWLFLWSWLVWLWEAVSTTVATMVTWVAWVSVRTLQALSNGLAVAAVVALAVVIGWCWHGRDDRCCGQSRGEDRELHGEMCMRYVMRG